MATVKLSIPSVGKTYEIDPDTLSYDEIEQVEEQVDLTWGELAVGLGRFSVKAVKVLLWIAMRRENPRLMFREVAFDPRDFSYTPPDDSAEAPHPNRAARRARLPKDGRSVSGSEGPTISA